MGWAFLAASAANLIFPALGDGLTVWNAVAAVLFAISAGIAFGREES